jgi:ubiquitin carboxyl-terminal hydrolase 36/42
MTKQQHLKAHDWHLTQSKVISNFKEAQANSRRKIVYVKSTNKFDKSPQEQQNNTQIQKSSAKVTSIVNLKKPTDNAKAYGLFDPAISVKYLRWLKPDRVGPGFFNDGNSCYLNSTLQCLLYCPALVQVLLFEMKSVVRETQINQHSNNEKSKNNSFANSKNNENHHSKLIIQLFRNLVEQVWCNETGSRTISPKGMVSTIRRVGKQFRPLRQEDAHEYMRQLLDCMHEEILKSFGVKSSDGKVAETSAISRLFGGSLCNSLTCEQCGYCSQTFNHFQDLSLDISKGVGSVKGAIQSFVKPEQLSAGNEWKCDKCKKKVKAKKQMTLAALPNVLVLQLKRFSFGNIHGKITKAIDFDEILQVPSTGEGGGGKHQLVDYGLTGVVVHHGSSTHVL